MQMEQIRVPGLSLSPWWQKRLAKASLSGEGASPRAPFAIQARLLEGLATLHEQPISPHQASQGRAETLEAAAYAFLAQNQPVRGYIKLLEARNRAERFAQTPPEREAYAVALLARRGLVLKGYTLEAAAALVLLALEVALARGYHPATVEVCYHLPLQLLAARRWPAEKTETARKRLTRALPKLKALGLLDYRPHVGNAASYQTGRRLGWRDGTVLQVRLTPGRARGLTYEQLTQEYRDQNDDIQEKRTARSKLSQTNSPKGESEDWLRQMKQEAIPLLFTESSAAISGVWDSSARTPEARVRNLVQDIKLSPKRGRKRAVGEGSTWLARQLDAGTAVLSRPLYAALLWGMLRAWDKGEDYGDALIAVLQGVVSDLVDSRNSIRKPGALLVLRLKERGLWRLLEGPQYRVSA